MQLALPVSVGAQIARNGTAPAWKAAAGALCSVAHPHAISADGVRPVSHHETNGSGPSHTADACALCAALNVMPVFTDAPALALPIPARAEPIRPVAAHAAAVTASLPTAYRSRAPPLVG